CKAGVTNEKDMNTLYVKGRYYTYKIVAVVNDEEGGIGARVYRRKRSKKTKIRKPIKKEKKPSYASWSQLFVLFIIFSAGVLVSIYFLSDEFSSSKTANNSYSCNLSKPTSTPTPAQIFLPPSLMTDRDIYRPGETVKITYKNAPPDGSLNVFSIWGKDSKDWDVSGNGTITYTIPENATLGEWTVYLFEIWTKCSIDKDILIVPIPKNYYLKADELVPDPQIHSIQTLHDSLMTVKLPRYNVNSFRCSHASAYLEWYLEGAGFDAYMVESERLNHAWVIVELPDGKVAIETAAFCEDVYQPSGIIISPEGKYEKYSMYYQQYLDYLDKYSGGNYILPKDFDDFMNNYLEGDADKYTYHLGYGGNIKTSSSEYYHDFDEKFATIEEAYSFYRTIGGIDWWNVKPFCSQLNWSTSCRIS
ncbi:hypothetical protein KAX08_00940, partial [candidate division WOR-3 bacterium]|nr:hypothetical protein [candidate division WOR-3 bacterium]